MQKEQLKTAIEQYVIDQVKKIRNSKAITQSELATMIGLSSSFIGDVENPTRRAKYNLNHLNKIAEKLDCEFQDFFPKKALI